MIPNLSRRSFVLATGVGALGATSLVGRSVLAQSDDLTYTFPNGSVVKWTEPWTQYDQSSAEKILPGGVAFYGANQGELVIGYYDSATSMDDVAADFLTFLGVDPTTNFALMGEDQTEAGADGVIISSKSGRVHGFTVDGDSWGLYIQLVDETELCLFVAPYNVFAAEMDSVQQSVTLNDVPVFDGVSGQDLQDVLASAGGVGGEYTDDSGFVHVQWIASWTVLEQDEFGIVLANPANSVTLYTQGVAFEGRTWQEEAEIWWYTHFDDQGDNAIDYGLVVTDDGFSYATKGQYGPRLGEGLPTESPEMYVMVFAADIAVEGADLVALYNEIQAGVQVNGASPFRNAEQFLTHFQG
ncbi:MAG: hypothetical protein M9934_02345 [Thermomicrobiales bacterium]|nr:hypothetical protein [Thermomicrobiales bacterium]